ncbi:cytochrome c oxidase assembly protein [Curtobacterium sp. MCBD17_032]|uniref:cytochrome c oxidase assembly protein n=1 Tax=Curtobacterium sp. MCBD17_032 TaxID=2175659 RepID=UPI0015E89FCC|nr:cytochrome c oxidase assembly protein [Curtobacterium sp. MCBD17_032]
MHEHGGVLGTFTLITLTVAGALYVTGAVGQRRRGDEAWPHLRTVSWIVGLLAVASVLVGPLGHAGNHDLVTHVLGHVVIGMVAPLLLVLGAPVTLARRTLDPVPAKRLGRLVGGWPTRALAFPVVAGVLDLGSVWLLYTGPVAGDSTRDPALHSVVMLWFLVVGLLLTGSVLGLAPGRLPTEALRGALLLAAVVVPGVVAVVMSRQGVPGLADDPTVQPAAAALAVGAVLTALALAAVVVLPRVRARRADPVATV